MTPARKSFVRLYFWYAFAASIAAIIIVILGYIPTVRIAGPDAVAAMLAGCGVSWLASCLAVAPLAAARAQGQQQMASAVLLSTGVRFIAVLFLVVPLTLSGWFEQTVLVVWAGISYLLLLLIDTVVAVRLSSGSPG
jgi:hypothetical protein